MSLPQSIFYVEISPLHEGDKKIRTRISPDSVGEFIAGYVVYASKDSTRKMGYLRKEELQQLLERGDYKIIDKPIN